MLAGSPSGRLVSWWPPAGEHCYPPDLESCEKTVPLPVTGRVDRCWDVVRARWREHCFIRALIVLPQAAFWISAVLPKPQPSLLGPSLICHTVRTRSHCSAPIHLTRRASGCAASGFIERDYAAPACTDSGQRRFSTQFLPKRQRSGVEMVYILVTAANWNGRPECVTSLPIWS